MRPILLLVTIITAHAAAAQAQTSLRIPADETLGYVEGVAHSAFGNVTSQSFGGEIGVNATPRVQVFLEAGRIRDTSPSSLGQSAQQIAGFLSQTRGGVGYSVRQPITFGIVGVRYLFPTSTPLEPYVLGGVGLARTKKDVSFSIGGTDVTDSIGQYGVALGTDLSGSTTNAMISLGAGAVWPAWKQVIVDLQYRWGRAFTDEAVNVNRVGIGIGVRF